MLLPYFMIKVDAGLPLLDFVNEGPLVIAFIAFALTGQFVHEVIDGDALVKHFSLRTCQLLIWLFSIISSILAIWAFVIIPHIYFIPFVFFPTPPGPEGRVAIWFKKIGFSEGPCTNTVLHINYTDH